MSRMSRRELALGAVAASAVAALRPGRALAQAVTPATGRDPLWYVNPDLRERVRTMMPMPDKVPALSDATLPALRKPVAPPPAPLATVLYARRTIPGMTGQPDVTLYVINAKANATRGGILHTHGGGYVLNQARDEINRLQILAQTLDCCIVTVEYRLAPETTYSGSIEDNYAGLLWLRRNARGLGVDPDRLAVMGESAGGGHAAILATVARDRGEVPIAFQCLTYPMLDDRTGSSRPMPFPIGALGWTAPANIYGWRSFLGMAPGGDRVPAIAVPARTANLAGLPPAWIGVGSIDLFVGEDLEYARRLIEAGVPTETLVVPGAPHGFDGFGADTGVGRQFNTARIDALRRALAG